MRWSFATVFFLAIMGFAAYFVFNEAVKGGGHVEVPDVVGLPMTQAATVLANATLEVGEQTQVASDRFPAYHVMLQRPAAGKVVREGKRIRVTVSAGTDQESVPALTGQTLESARAGLERTRLAMGSVCRIPNDAPRDTVLSMDPRPGLEVPTGSEVHFLVSDGSEEDKRATFMPDLIGAHVKVAMTQLEALDVNVVPIMVDRPVEYDKILSQQPENGELLQPGATVRFEYRPANTTNLPGAQRRISLRFEVPNTSFNPEIRVDAVDKNGSRGQIYPRAEDYRNGAPPRFSPGSVIPFTFDFEDELTLEFYADGQLDTTYYYEGRRDPVITNHSQPEFIEPPVDGAEPDLFEPQLDAFEP